MAWKPLLDRLDGDVNNLPLILAGPILRKVTKESVTVWFVLREKQEVSMHVWRGNKIVIPLTTTNNNCVTVGDSIHIYTVTAKLGESLIRTSTYHYDISFNNKSNYLIDDGILAKKGVDLSYDGSGRPNFTLPEKMSHLNIVHGSCRKPHAEGRDAMEGLEKMIAKKLNDNTTYARWNNPQLLFLTGDQIYADDVADAMLYMIQDAAKILFGWDENFDETIEMQIGKRKDNNTKIGLTSGESKSHLYTFQEYCVMYLMVWSDALWQDDDKLPTYKLIFPQKINNKLNEDFYRWGGRVGDDPLEPIIPIKDLHSDFEKEITNLKTFKETLAPIRKALANIPTYMMFDDHDVTDDWNLNWQWCKEIYSKTIGLQLLRNALTAYTLFQGIGNTPEQFEDGNGKAFLNEIDDLKTKLSPALDSYLNISPIVIDAPHNEERPSVPQILNWHFQLSFDEIEIIVLDTRTMREYPKEHPIGFCGLISKTGFDIQLPKENSIEDKMVFVVSPSPLIETPVMVGTKTYGPGFENLGATFFDAEGWEINEKAFERMLARLSFLKKPKENIRNNQFIILSGDIHHGYTAKIELWADRLFEEPDNNKITTHNTFIQFTSSPLKNEDIKTRFLHNVGYETPFPSIIKEGFSASKKAGWVGLVLGGVVTTAIRASNPIPIPADTFGWNGKAGEEKIIGFANSVKADSTDIPALYPYKKSGSPITMTRFNADLANMNILEDPEWVYQKSYFLASGTHHIENIKIRKPNPKKINTSDEVVYKEMSSDFKKYAKQWGNGKEIVGENNIGQISFKAEEDTLTAVQNLWWHLGDEDESSLEIYPLSEFEIKLNDESTKPKFK